MQQQEAITLLESAATQTEDARSSIATGYADFASAQAALEDAWTALPGRIASMDQAVNYALKHFGGA